MTKSEVIKGLPFLIDVSYVNDLVIKEDINSGLNYLLFVISSNIFLAISELKPKNGKMLLNPDLTKQPFRYHTDFYHWLSEQNHVENLNEVPTDNTIKLIRFLALKAIYKDKTFDEEINELRAFKKKAFQYILIYYLFTLEKFEREYLEFEPIRFGITSRGK